MNFQQNITNRDELINYLSAQANSYTLFILAIIDRNPETLEGQITNKHHIIPRHSGGPDKPFNILIVTLEEHIEAHRLLFENYGALSDSAAFHMMSGRIAKGEEVIRQKAQQTMKDKKIGFFSSETQRNLANRPHAPRRPYTRDAFVTAALERGFTLEKKVGDTLETVVIEPSECPNLTFVVNKLMQCPSMHDKRTKWDLEQHKSQNWIVSSLTRIITGYRCSKTGKMLFSVLGWTVKGINTNIN